MYFQNVNKRHRKFPLVPLPQITHSGEANCHGVWTRTVPHRDPHGEKQAYCQQSRELGRGLAADPADTLTAALRLLCQSHDAKLLLHS